MKKLTLVLISLLSFNRTMAQSSKLGSWTILNVKYNFDENWSVFGESQLRSLKLYNDFHYYEIKGGFNYKIHQNLVLTFGSGS